MELRSLKAVQLHVMKIFPSLNKRSSDLTYNDLASVACGIWRKREKSKKQQ